MDWKLACPRTGQAEIAFPKDMLSSTQQYIPNSGSAKIMLCWKDSMLLSSMYRIFRSSSWSCFANPSQLCRNAFLFSREKYTNLFINS
jgi:hypothetical protein